MKQVELTYNPYLVKTSIKVDGSRPISGSALNIPDGARLQEWVEQLPFILKKELHDKIKISFVGTRMDYEDVVSAMNKIDFIDVVLKEEKSEVESVEKKIDELFVDIQKGPIEDLKSKTIRDTFEKAKNSEFEVNVVATMSSGKSTLINALLGKKLMPAKNEATTATIVKIRDVDGKKNFSAMAFDKSHHLLKEYKDITLKDMQTLNDNKDVYEIDIEGDIKFVSSSGMTLVLVDTPGPNNSRDTQHQEMTYEMLKGSEKSLVLFVMNGRQLGINDEKLFLDFVCEKMKDGGKMSRDRYIFAVNQLDSFRPNPEDDGPDCINKALLSVQKSLEERGIKDANLFPVSAGVALEKRIDDDEEELLHPFSKKSRKYKEMQLNDYYQFSHQPQSVRETISREISLCSDEDKVEYYSGIRNIEEAICLYVNKYARTTKICDLVLSFNGQLTRNATIANLENQLRNSNNAKSQIEAAIAQANNIIGKAKEAQATAQKIDITQFEDSARAEISRAGEEIRSKFSSVTTGFGEKVKLETAKHQKEQIESYYSQYLAQFNVIIKEIVQENFKQAVLQSMNTYFHDMDQLGISNTRYNFSSFSGSSLSNLDLTYALTANAFQVDESYVENRTGTRTVESSIGRNSGVGGAAGVAIGFLCGGPLGALVGGICGAIGGGFTGKDTHTEEYVHPVTIPKTGDYVDMQSVAIAARASFATSVDQVIAKSRQYINEESRSVTRQVNDKIAQVYTMLNNNLNTLKDLSTNLEVNKSVLEQKSKERDWLLSIQKRVNDLVNY